MTGELQRIIATAQIQTLFQPIYHSHEPRILGYEALSRGPSDSMLHSPIELFRTAEQLACQGELELLCVQLAMKRFVQHQFTGKLFINISPSVLLQCGTDSLLQHAQVAGINPALIVIELTEKHPAATSEAIIHMVRQLQQLGFMVAIDDLGTGNSGLKLWSEIRPDFVKLDIYFANQIDQDVTKRQFVSSISDLANKLGCHLILEGVEREEEFQVAREIGILYCQGFWLGRPLPMPQDASYSFTWKSDDQEQQGFAPLAQMAIQVQTVQPETPALVVLTQFQQSPELFCIPILDAEESPIGIIRRTSLISQFAQPYGHSLYAKVPIHQLMSPPICIDVHDSLVKASEHLTEQSPRDELDAWFLICDQNRYLGIGRLRDLMQQLTRHKITMARYANPLTLLPGNVPIQRTVTQWLKDLHPFMAAYCDLNDFKPFNDICGYERGDQMIKLVARLLRQRFPPPAHFIGHLGGDDFILLIRHDAWQDPIRQLQQEFRRQRVHYYRHEDVQNQGIWGKDRDGLPRMFPLVDLSIGVFCYQPAHPMTASQLSLVLSLTKHRAKHHPDHLYCLESQELSTLELY